MELAEPDLSALFVMYHCSDLFKQLQTEQQPPEAEAAKPVEAETVVTESPATKGKKSPPPTK